MLTKHLAKKNHKTWLSPTALEALARCPRCFWLKYKKGIDQPEGIVSRLANRFDVVIKKYFDLYRQIGDLPPMVSNKLAGKLENPFTEIYFYHYDKDYGFYGKLDDCLVNAKGEYTPIDHKTSSSDPREKETLPAYQTQLDCYSFLLEKNGKKTTGKGHLIYFYPEHHTRLHEGFKMLVFVQTLKTNPAHAQNRFLEALKVLEKPIPQPSPKCPFCEWYDTMNKTLTPF